MSWWLWSILACGDSTETVPMVEQSPEQSVVKPVQQAVQPKQRPKGPPHATNGQLQAGGPAGHPPNGQPMHKPEPFHAEVDFAWVEGEKVSSKPKSIIWISLDTVHAKRMSVYGGIAQVPNLQRFSESAVVFEQAISHFPETALSHWTMMSSVLPEVHGNVPANGGSIYTGPTLADIAKHHKYTTGGFIGGVTMTDQASGFGRGFDVYDDQFTFSFADMSREGTEVTTRTVDWIAKQQGSFFAFAHYFDAHFPYTPSENLYDIDYTGTIDGTDEVLRPYRDGQKIPSERDVQHVLALYDAEITELDSKIAPLLELANENTIVVVTSDHGESFSHDYYFNHRAGLWDEVTHVPLLIGGGGLTKSRVAKQIGLIDVLPTVLQLAGLPSDQRFMGSSRVNWIGEKSVDKGTTVYSITDPWMPNPQFAVRTEQAKWIATPQSNLVYDLSADPEEKQNLQTVPSALSTAKETYQQQIQSLKKWQTTSPRKRQISDEECKRLMALGYTTCGQ